MISSVAEDMHYAKVQASLFVEHADEKYPIGKKRDARAYKGKPKRKLIRHTQM